MLLRIFTAEENKVRCSDMFFNAVIYSVKSGSSHGDSSRTIIYDHKTSCKPPQSREGCNTSNLKVQNHTLFDFHFIISWHVRVCRWWIAWTILRCFPVMLSLLLSINIGLWFKGPIHTMSCSHSDKDQARYLVWTTHVLDGWLCRHLGRTLLVAPVRLASRGKTDLRWISHRIPW